MENLYNEDKKYVLNTYVRSDLEIERGEGSYLVDTNGNRYLDMYSGISVNNFGHDKKIAELMVKQALKYVHLSNYFVSEPIVKLAKLIVENSFASKVFFTNSGTEANEAAIKLCRKYGKQFNENKCELLSAYNSFHGRTNGSLAITGQEKYQKAFTPTLEGVSYFEYNNIDSLRAMVSQNTCGLFLEIIQGEGGVRSVSEEFVEEVVKLSKEFNFLVVIDEVQTGLGRTGTLFAHENYDFTPDVITLAKSLGGGIPLGAMLVCDKLEEVLKPGDHGSTFGGNPVSCACGTYILDKLINTNLCDNVKTKGNSLLKKLVNLKEKYPNIISDVRGRGLMIGVDVGDFVDEIKYIAKKNMVLLNSTNNTVIRLLPSLYISECEIEQFLEVFEKGVVHCNNESNKVKKYINKN